ncbi:MAG: NAD(P)/FAD-dependent oxidoreductase [Planctomycetes bacterium]|nr:NAD(P)/FAD-dependent oxidoreductase [Planctomycetota bacterium]
MLKDGEKGAILQKDKETYAIAAHLPCGVVTPDQLRTIADVAEKYEVKAMKFTAAERLALVGVKEEDIDAVWADLGMKPGAAVGLCIRSVKACPGTAFCRLGLQDSLGMGMKLDEKYHGMSLPNKLKIGISGCSNHCTDAPVRDIGLVGAKDGWRIYVGGCVGRKPRLGDVLCEGLNDDEALAMVERIIGADKRLCEKKERLGVIIDRIGLNRFKEEVQA